LDELLGEDGKWRPRGRFDLQDLYTIAAGNALPTRTQARALKEAAALTDGSNFNKQEPDNIEWARWSWNPVIRTLTPLSHLG
jgi:hypothetical protein